MKKIIAFIFIVSSLLAQTKSDIAFTTGYNKFDDPDFLRKGRFFFGIRGGVYEDNYGYQLGYEHAKGANCQGLNLKRIYANALKISKQPNGLDPYGLVSAGYEMSNIHEHKPSQVFIGVGVGIRKSISPNVNGFIETRVLRKLKSDDTDIITTLGLAYVLNSTNNPSYTQQNVIYKHRVPQKVFVPSIVDSGYEQKNEPITTYVEPLQDVVIANEKHYYVQLVALSSTNPNNYIEKLYKRGIDNVEVKQIVRGDRVLSLVVVGPFYDKKEAVKNLRKLKRVSSGAFVKKF